MFGASGFTHQHISVFKVVPPVRSDLPLASNVPNIQFKTLRLDALNVESLERTQGSVPNSFCNLRTTPEHAATDTSELHIMEPVWDYMKRQKILILRQSKSTEEPWQILQMLK